MDRQEDQRLGLVILAGGESRRMGRPKAMLPWKSTTLLGYLVSRAKEAGFTDIIVSAHNEEQIHQWDTHLDGVTYIYDEGERRGPLGGIVSSFISGRSDAYAVVAVDMPLVDFACLQQWSSRLNDSVQGVLPLWHGEKQALGAVYARSTWEKGRAQLRKGLYKLSDWIATFPIEEVPVDQDTFMMQNINTLDEYRLLRAKIANQSRKVPVVSIVASKRKTGKTTLVEALVRTLSQRGLRVGLVKSDRHGFAMDRPNSDTSRAMEAGASAVAIAGPQECAMRVRTQEPMDVYRLTQSMDVDLVLLETRSQGVIPLIEVVRPDYTEEYIGSDLDVLRRVDITMLNQDACIEELADLVQACISQ